MKTRFLHLVLIVTAGVVITIASVNVVMATGTLTNLAAQPSSNFPDRAANYVVQFTTATTGMTIAKIVLIFPAGTVFPSGQVAIPFGVGSGTSSVSGSGGSTPTLTYTLDTAITPTGPIKIGLLLQKFKNPLVGGDLSIQTQTSAGVTIDGPTTVAIGIGTNSLGTTLTVDDTNHYVGIGNSLTPQKTLDVGGDIGLSGNIYSSSGSGGIKIVPGSGGAVCIGTGC